MANPTLVKQPTEADNKERNELMSEDSNVPTINGGNLLAQFDHEIDVLLQATARSNPIMRWKQETNYRIGEDQRELGGKYVAHARDWFRGHVLWESGEIVDSHDLKRVVDNPTITPREAMGHNDKSEWEPPHKDPVCFMNYLPITDLETGEFVVFSSGTTGGKNRHREALQRVRARDQSRPQIR